MHTSARKSPIVWTCIAVAILANVAGYSWNLYEQISWFDKVLHAFTSFAVTLLLALFLYGIVLSGARSHPILYVLTVASLGIAIGAVWEIAEWSYDQVVAGNVIKGKTDTIIDLIVDAIGALIAGMVNVGMIKGDQ
jgi:VanZ family protein